MEKTTLEKAVKEARKEYFREWRKKNSDKVKQYNADYWRRKAEKKLQEEASTQKTTS